MYSPATSMKITFRGLSSNGESRTRTSPLYFPRTSTNIEDFHAGDLNNWYARFLPEAVPGETIYSEEFEEEIDPIAHEKQYLGELKDIRKVTDSFDLVMFPIDGRIGNGYTLGGRQFIERFKVGMFVPMHFVASGFESAWRMKDFTDEKGIPFWKIRKEGETIEL